MAMAPASVVRQKLLSIENVEAPAWQGARLVSREVVGNETRGSRGCLGDAMIVASAAHIVRGNRRANRPGGMDRRSKASESLAYGTRVAATLPQPPMNGASPVDGEVGHAC